MARDFNLWLSRFKESIADYKYYVDFEKIHANVDDIKVELNILNSLISSKNIEEQFLSLVKKYPETLRCIPILLAVRATEIKAMDDEGAFVYSFKKMNYSPQQYLVFMRKTGLFNLMEKHIIHNLVDYVTGVETGLDSNGRKNRGGKLMENLVERHLQKIGLKREVNYFKEFSFSNIERQWDVDLSLMSNKGKTDKRLDFVVKTDSMVYGIETNFYSGGGSKLNETARSYKNLAVEARGIDGFTFVWITDGYKGWKSARRNLEETFDVMEHLYNIDDLENGILKKILK
ncbi:MAG: type II restriction endonuclease [Sphaerochaetaceae bacterium]